MGKKGKKSRFNQVLDIDFSYSSNSIADGTAAPPDLNLTAEKVSELQRIKAQLPSAPQSVRIEEDIARIPESGPFRLVLANVSFNATRIDIEEFFLPITPTQIRIAENDGQSRGLCFVDFASKTDLANALDKNNAFLLTRRVTMRIADQQNEGNTRRGYGDREGFGRRNYGKSRGYDNDWPAEQTAWVRRPSRPTQPSDDKPAYQPPSIGHATPQLDSAPTQPPPPLERPIIRIAPRSKPITPAIEGNGGGADSAAARRAAIFGAAKPVDIVAREKDLEKKLACTSLSDTTPTAACMTVGTSPLTTQTTPQSTTPKQNAWAKPLVPNKD